MTYISAPRDASAASVRTGQLAARTAGRVAPEKRDLANWLVLNGLDQPGFIGSLAEQLVRFKRLSPRQWECAQQLRDERENPQPQQARKNTPWPDVPEGHYATPSRTGTNDLDFWRVDRPEKGSWKGYTFVKRIIGGHPDTNVRGKEARQALEAIQAAGVEAARTRYGQEIGQCWKCNRSLTDELSRQLGIGPDDWGAAVLSKLNGDCCEQVHGCTQEQLRGGEVCKRTNAHTPHSGCPGTAPEFPSERVEVVTGHKLYNPDTGEEVTAQWKVHQSALIHPEWDARMHLAYLENDEFVPADELPSEATVWGWIEQVRGSETMGRPPGCRHPEADRNGNCTVCGAELFDASVKEETR